MSDPGAEAKVRAAGWRYYGLSGNMFLSPDGAADPVGRAGARGDQAGTRARRPGGKAVRIRRKQPEPEPPRPWYPEQEGATTFAPPGVEAVFTDDPPPFAASNASGASEGINRG